MCLQNQLGDLQLGDLQLGDLQLEDLQLGDLDGWIWLLYVNNISI
jgi:hypothetical protein